MAKKQESKKQVVKENKSKVDPGYEEVSLDKIPDTKPPADKDFETMPGAFPDLWVPVKVGDSKIGLFIGSKVVDFSSKTKTELRRIGYFQDSEGKRFAFWDCAALRTLFDNAKILLGSWVKIVFKGEKAIKGKKQPMKDLEVGLDKKGMEVLKKALKDVPF